MKSKPAPHPLIASLEAPLYTYADAQAFWEREQATFQALSAAEKNGSKQDAAVWKTLFACQTMQAAWLEIEHVFDEDPTLDGLLISRDEEDAPPAYLFVEMSSKEEIYALGAHPQQLDEKLQGFLNDMGRKTYSDFHNDLVNLEWIQRDELIDCARKVLGGDWNAERNAQNLEKAFPEVTQEPRRNRPRV